MKIILTSNSSWNLYNFRKGLIEKLIENHHQVIVVAPRDKYSDLLKTFIDTTELGIKYKGDYKRYFKNGKLVS